MFARRLPVRVAKIIKIPFSARAKVVENEFIQCFRQFISGRQKAYTISSNYGTLFFYKKSNTIVQYYLPEEKDCSEIFVTPIAEKNEFTVHYSNAYKRSVRGSYYHIIGINSEPYKVIIEKVNLDKSQKTEHTNIEERVGSKIIIVNMKTNEKILELVLTGHFSIGFPIYNNYVPIINIVNRRIAVFVLDIAERKAINFAGSWLKNITKSVGNHLAKFKTVPDWNEVNLKLTQGRLTDYKIAEVRFTTDNNYIINKCVFHVSADELFKDPILFTVEIGFENEIMRYKIILPKHVNIEELGINGIPNDYVVENKVLRLHLINKENIRADVLYKDARYAILKPPFSEEKYYIVNRDGHIKYIIDSYVDCGNFRAPRYLFDLHFDDDFIIILHKSSIMLYSITRGEWWVLEINNQYNKIDFCHYEYDYYYIKKCRKVVFVLLCKSDFGKSEFIIIDLKSIDDKVYYTRLSIFTILEKEVRPYFRSTHRDFPTPSILTFGDYSVEVNNGTLYLRFNVLTLYSDSESSILIEYDLCNSTHTWKEFKIDVPLKLHKLHGANADTPLYLSYKSLALKGLPKYLPMYSLRNLYDIITNKISNYGLVIEKRVTSTRIIDDPLSDSKKYVPLMSLYAIDSRFNRTSTVFRDMPLLGEYSTRGEVLVRPLHQDIAGIYHIITYGNSGSTIHIIGVIIINELAIVN